VRHLYVPRRDRHAPLPHLWQPAAAAPVPCPDPLTRRDEPRRPAVRRDADGGVRIGTTWESVTERLIREAQEAGEFDDLPGRGRRLLLDDDPREGEQGLAFHILRTNDAVPPWIAADREARRCADLVERILGDAGTAAHRGGVTPATRARYQARLTRAIAEHMSAVESLNALAPSLALHRLRPDVARLEARLQRALDGQASGDRSRPNEASRA
jgi:hypothetical protein